MDPNANAGGNPVNPPPPPHGNTAPAASGGEQPDHAAEVSALKAWFRENGVGFVISSVVIALVIIYLDPIDTLKVVIGLGLVIFIHELGHFLAAKWCDVHVKTFSIGFGPAVPFCSFKWGETTYMIGIIPLGGYVNMVGEGEGVDGEEAEEDPRSFRKKTVGQRMLIISAGVIMNILLGMACFVAAYMHGVREEPAILGSVVSGGAAWRAGMQTGDQIVKIQSRDNPTFKDLRPFVMSTQKGESVTVVVQREGVSEPLTFTVEPLREEGTYFPTLGITTQPQLKLLSLKKKGIRPTVPGSPAAAASDPAFEPGDRIVAMTNPANPAEVTALRPDARDPNAGPDLNDYYDRMAKLAGQPIIFRVLRKDEKQMDEILVQPAFRSSLGVRMQMGRVAALRVDGPAARAGVQAWAEDQPSQGDKIKAVKLPEAGGRETWLTNEAAKDLKAPANVDVRPLDPVLLPLEVRKWADRTAGAGDRTVRLVVLRKVGHQEDTPVELAMTYDAKFRHDREAISLQNSPVPLGGLGLAYWVQGVVDAVEPGGPADGQLQTADQVVAVRFKTTDGEGNLKPGEWEEIDDAHRDRQWAAVEAAFQSRPPHELDLKVKRGAETIEVTLKGREDRNWPTEDRGLVFQQDYRVHQADDVGHALQLGGQRTWRFIREVYMNLYAMAFGRVSAKTMSGPLTIANVSYKFAGEDFWQFLLFLGMISVNLAVVNFLPIPVLDGGHMVFLLLEWVLGRPVPEKVFAAAMWIGLSLILLLMVFVLVLDIRRLFFGLF